MKQSGNDTLLIIDDMPHHLKLLKQYLQRYDFNIQLANSGVIAFKMLENGNFKPDLILLDAIMPEMDGYEVCKKLKANPQFADIPVIFMTSLWEINDKLSAFSVGASDFLIKPFPPEELIARITVHLELNHTKRHLEQEITLRERYYQQLHFLEQELEIAARLVGQQLQHKINTLQTVLEKISTPRTTECCQKMTDIFQEINIKIDELFFITNINPRKLEKQSLDMAEIIHTILARLTPKYPQLKITFPETWLEVQGYALWVEKIWELLLTFAIKQAGKNLQLNITNELVNSTVLFSVRNNGTSFTKTQIAALLSNHEQLHITNELFLVRYLVERCNGEFYVESKGLIGNTFCFTLPATLDFGNTCNRYLSLTL